MHLDCFWRRICLYFSAFLGALTALPPLSVPRLRGSVH